MKIAIIDADIIGRKSHRFPNLACMKLSTYYKREGHAVTLHTSFEGLDAFDKVFISKVFVETEIPGEPKDKSGKTADTVAEWYVDNEFLKQPNIEYGGTGFFYEKAPPLPCEIEHAMPDYHLYDDFVAEALAKGTKPEALKYYTDYSIGYLTRGCFRRCANCVNKRYKAAFAASALSEFYDPDRKKICLLDDNFFAFKDWRELIRPVKETGKMFQFKQGLDERLLTPATIEEINTWKYEKEFIFAFDFIEDKPTIVRKLQMIYETIPNRNWQMKFYVFCGFDPNGKYDRAFWERDVESVFDRVMTLARYGAKPYVMRFEKVYKSEFAPFYATLAAWCNQLGFFKTQSFRSFAMCRGMTKKGYREFKRDAEAYLRGGGKKGLCWRDMERHAEEWPEIAGRYFDITPADIWKVDV